MIHKFRDDVHWWKHAKDFDKNSFTDSDVSFFVIKNNYDDKSTANKLQIPSKNNCKQCKKSIDKHILVNMCKNNFNSLALCNDSKASWVILYFFEIRQLLSISMDYNEVLLLLYKYVYVYKIK